MKCLAGGLRRICQALILPLNTTLINPEISDVLDKQPEMLWNQQTCKQAFEQKCKKLCRVEKSTGPLDPVFFIFYFFHNEVVSFITLKKGK